MLPDSYLLTVARSVGCPPMWEEDCAQEQRIGIFLAPSIPEKVIARRRAIDFMRVVVGRKPPPVCAVDGLSLPDEGMESVDRVLDYELVLSRLKPAQVNAMLGGRSEGRKSQVRKLARGMLA